MAHARGESDWGDWLAREIAETVPDGVSVWYLGCNGFVLKASDGTTVFVDPYLGTGDPPRLVRMVPIPFDPSDIESADAVFATHEHSDHVHGPTQGPLLAGTDAQYYAPEASLAILEDEDWFGEWDVSPDRLTQVSPGDAFDVGSFTVRVSSANDPDAEEPVGYLFEHDSGTFFHGGDARPGDAFERVGDRHDIDLAALAFGTSGMLTESASRDPVYKRWYSTENEIVEAAAQLRTDRLLPTHWDIWKGLTAEPTALHDHARSFERPRRLEIVEIGDSVDL